MVTMAARSFVSIWRQIAMSHVKEILLELAKNLPDECTWEDVMYRIYVRQQIEEGLKDEEEGRLIPHDEVFKEFKEFKQ
jgi:predicted transcriptional regulator